MLPHLIALDLDGTLLGSHGMVLPRTAEVLEAAHRAGVLVVVATGRPEHRAREITEQLEFVTHTVCRNGSVVFGQSGPPHLFSLDRRLADVAIAAVRAGVPGAGFELATEVGTGSEPGFDRFVEHVGHETVDDVAMIPGREAVKVSVFHPELGAYELMERLRGVLPTGIGILHSGLDFVELGPPGLSKAAGLSWLCERAEIDPGHTMAFGDGPNDHEMLAWAGLGVAMGNAGEATKALADRVTASCDADGIAEVVEPLLVSAGVANLPHVDLPGPVEPRGTPPAAHPAEERPTA